MNWRFNAWAKYPNYSCDEHVGEAVARITGLTRIEPKRGDTGERVVLEGGAIDTDGEGTLLATEECLLSDVQSRNPGMSRGDYEALFHDALPHAESLQQALEDARAAAGGADGAAATLFIGHDVPAKLKELDRRRATRGGSRTI